MLPSALPVSWAFKVGDFSPPPLDESSGPFLLLCLTQGRGLLSALMGCERREARGYGSLKSRGLQNQCQAGVLPDFAFCVWEDLKAGKGYLGTHV